MKSFLHFFPRYTCLVIVILVLHAGYSALGQTPGLILKPATGTNASGVKILDPDGDGYVSKPIDGVQMGFQSNDIAESEIPYVALVKPDPSGDILKGPEGGFTEIVGTDEEGNNAILTYSDGTNLFFRFRLSGYAANSKMYSILVDTDQQFGFTGENRDLNAMPGNAGFEVEIVLKTNFAVDVYDVDGKTPGIPLKPEGTYSYEVHCQKSIALSTAGDTPDYFYEFYVPYAALPFDINTKVRIVALTGMSPSPAIGNSSASDVGGVTVNGISLDQTITQLVEVQTPTLPGQEVLARSACPTIDAATTTATVLTGTTTEAAGTIITAYVYDKNDILKGSGTVTTTGTGWSITVSSLSPSVTLAAGYKVKATATAPGKGVSHDNCDIGIVAGCVGQTSTNATITKVSGNKGFHIEHSFPSGTIITWYKSDFSIATIVSGYGGSIPNPVTTTAAGQPIVFECKTGQCFVNDVFYFTFQEPGKCVSNYLSDCQYSVSGTSSIPVITTSPITTSTTSISGTCASSVDPGTVVNLYADGNFLKSAIVINSTLWEITELDLSGHACKIITVTAADGGKCPTGSASGIPVTKQAFSPVINYSGCALAAPTSISGYSSEIGATIELYKNSGTTPIGSTTVPSTGIWTISSISSLTSGNTIHAKVATGGCLTASENSNQVTISTQTNISSYTIGITTPTEGQTSVSGTISGGSYPVTLKVYIDEAVAGQKKDRIEMVNITDAGAWTLSDLNLFDLALGSSVQVTLTSGSECESELSPVLATVQCLVPSNRSITAENSTLCANSYGTIIVQASEPGVLYTPVAEDGITVAGYGGMGNGQDLHLTTFALISNPTILKVKAYKFPILDCQVVMSGSVAFNLTPQPDAPIANSTQVYCSTGTIPTLADLAVSKPADCTVNWYAMASGGTPIQSTTQVIANTTYYAESVSTITGCRSNTRAAVLVQAGIPTAPTASLNQTFCVGATVGNLSATLSGPGTVSWFAASTGGLMLSTETLLESGKTYYAQTTQGGCVSNTRVEVMVIINPIPSITITTPAAICEPGVLTLEATASTGTINWYDAPINGNLVGTGPSFKTPLISSTTTYYVDATLDGCTTSIRTPVVATVNTLPTISITTAPVCTADESAYSLGITVSAGTLTSTNGTVVNPNGNIWTVSNVPKGTNITLTVTHNGCTKTLSITAPDCGCEAVMPPVSGGDKQYCSGNAIPSISATVVGSGVTIDWYANATGGTPLLTDAFSYSPSAAGAYYAEASNISTGCKSSIRTAITVTENPAPAINSMTASACSGVGFTITPTNSIDGIVPSGTSYSWSAPSGTGFTGGQAGIGATHISGNLLNITGMAQTATYTVTPVSGTCTGAAFTITVSVHPTATVTSVTGTTPMAIGATATFTAHSVVLGKGTGTWSSSNMAVATVDAATGAVTAISPGTSNITYNINGGCGGTASASTTVTVVPKVNFITSAQSSTNESVTLTIVFQLSAASSQPVTIPFTVGGTANIGSDYTISASSVTIPSGSTSGSINITLVNDNLVEGNERIILTMGTPVNAVPGSISIHTITITDNDFNPADDVDGDGIVNTVDVDDDNDGIPDSIEGSANTDNDSKANWFDLDSDNDGIYDILEAGGTDTDFDGKVDNFVDGNGNGIADVYDTDCNRSVINGSGSQVVSFLNVSNENSAVDSNTGTFAALYNTNSYIIIPLQHTLPTGTTISILLSCDGNNTTTTGIIEQSLNNKDYSNSETFSRFGRTGVILNYTLKDSDARYIRIKRTNNESIRVYDLTYSFTICNGTRGTAISDYDSDNDGNKDRIEIDSDNDGCKDVIEAGFTDANSDGMLDGTGTNSLGFVIGNQNGYTAPANVYLTSAYDYREANSAAVGGTVSGTTTICSGSGSGTLTLSGYTGVISKWQSSVYPFTTWTNIPVTSSNYSAAILTETTHFRAVVVTSVCSSAPTIPAVVTVRPTPSATISGTTSVCLNGAAPVITFTNPQDIPVTITYNINEANPTAINVGANTFATVSVPTAAAGTFSYNLASVIYQTAPTCSNTLSGTATITVVAPPAAVAGTGIATCSNSGVVNITGGSSSTNYSALIWTSSGSGTFTNATSLTLATYQPSISDITAGTVTLTLTAYGNTPCEEVISTKILTIYRDGYWTGVVDNDWNNPANWACNQLPTLTTNVLIASSKPRYPLLSTGVTDKARDITIQSGASVTVNSNTLQVAGAISNAGTFDATKGTIEMIGSAAQNIGANAFLGNTIQNLKVNNASGVTLLGPLNITGVVSPLIGNLSSGGHLALLSTPSQTALIEGAGTGNVSGIVNMQRYLPSSFGYKYFSSPFQKANVGAFATLVILKEKFPTFYRYDENNRIVNADKSGWVIDTIPTSPLIPIAGYAANLGSTTTSNTFTMSGVVNNGDLDTTLYNHNREYTQGFNLVGNPYPSPIDWNASGWIKTNIDDAIYFFNAGNTNRYTGGYSSYVNRISSDNGIASNIIAGMQGFFVHVTDGSYPVTATLGMNNAVRKNILNPVFKSATIDSRPTMRLTAGFEINDAIEDAAVVYFDPTAHVLFEKEKDALKLENTDELIPNIYTLAGGRKLSINGLSEPSDSVSFIPLGITTFRDGMINFRAEDVDDLPFMQVYLADAVTGKYHDLKQSPDFSFSLQRGVYDSRFKLVFSKAPFTGHYPGLGKLFTLMRSGNKILVRVDLPDNSKGNLLVSNLLGQTIMRREVTGKQTVEINQSITTGVYVITLVSGKRTESEKIIMRTDYE